MLLCSDKGMNIRKPSVPEMASMLPFAITIVNCSFELFFIYDLFFFPTFTVKAKSDSGEGGRDTSGANGHR